MHDWLSDSRRQLMGLPIKGWHAIKSVFGLAFRRFPYRAVSQIRPKRRLEWSIEYDQSKAADCYPLYATLTKPLPNFTVPLPCFFPVCLVGTLQIASGATKKA
jgi:hypothetical protein